MMKKKNTEKTDNELIDAFLSRDERAVALLSDKYGDFIFTIACNILSDKEDAEECVNDTYMKIWQSIPPDRPESLKAYLSKIVRNIALDKYKEKTRQKRISSDKAVSLAEIGEFVPDAFGLEDRYDAMLLRRAVDGFINSLPKRRKYIFICRYYCDDSVKTIADSLNLAESTVYRDLELTTKKLKNDLIKEGLWYEKG